MKIGIDVRELRRGASTGIGRYLRAFLRFAQESPRGHSFTFYGDETTDFAGLEWGRASVLRAPWPLYDRWRLPRALREDAIELFFSPYYKAPPRSPCPTVVTIHDLMFMHVDEGNWSRPLKNAMMRSACARMAAAAAGVMTVSEYSKGEIERILGIGGEKIAVFPNCVPMGFAPAKAERVEAALRPRGLSPGFVLYVGSFKPSKNVPALLAAYAGLEPELRRAHPLVLAGARDARAAALVDGSSARFLSAVGDDELVALYSACALCVVPSLFEGFGMPALEAMACGAAVLVSSRTSLPEVVGEAGEISEPDPQSLRAAMARLLPDETRLKDLRRRGLERAKGYSYRAIGERMLTYLERCAQGKR